MAEIVYMPKLSDTMTEGVVAEWHKKVGDEISSGELLAEIETDKATMEFESFYDGVLLHIGVDKGQTAPVNAVLAIIGEKGEDVKALLANAEAPAQEEEKEITPEPVKETVPAPTPVVASAPVPAPAPVAASTADSNGKIFASPLA
ncbi:MAG: biotin/lipoyl-containing protein, partial [Crocinitomicaceae bacterium]